jgi:hypothetical protein
MLVKKIEFDPLFSKEFFEKKHSIEEILPTLKDRNAFEDFLRSEKGKELKKLFGGLMDTLIKWANENLQQEQELAGLIEKLENFKKTYIEYDGRDEIKNSYYYDMYSQGVSALAAIVNQPIPQKTRQNLIKDLILNLDTTHIDVLARIAIVYEHVLNEVSKIEKLLPSPQDDLAVFLKNGKGLEFREFFAEIMDGLIQWSNDNLQEGEKVYVMTPLMNFKNIYTIYEGVNDESNPHYLIMYRQGTLALIHMTHLMQDQSIPLAMRQSVIKNMTAHPNITACADGAYSHIDSACNKLLAYKNLPAALRNIRATKAQQFVIELINDLDLKLVIPEAWETHYVRDVLNAFADQLGIEVVEDKYTSSINKSIGHTLSVNFQNGISKIISAETVIEQIINGLDLETLQGLLDKGYKLSDLNEFEGKLDFYGVEAEGVRFWNVNNMIQANGDYSKYTLSWKASYVIFLSLFNRLGNGGYFDLKKIATKQINKDIQVHYFPDRTLKIAYLHLPTNPRNDYQPFIPYCVETFSSGEKNHRDAFIEFLLTENMTHQQVFEITEAITKYLKSDDYKSQDHKDKENQLHNLYDAINIMQSGWKNKYPMDLASLSEKLTQKLLVAAVANGHADVVKLLLAERIDINNAIILDRFKLFELAEKSPEITQAISQAMTMQDGHGRTVLHVMAKKVAASFPKLVELAEKSPEIATAIAKAMTMQNDQHKTALHVMAEHAPANLPKLVELAEKSPEITIAISEAMTRQSDRWTLLHTMGMLSPENLPELLEFAKKLPKIVTAIAKTMTMQAGIGNWTALHLMAGNAPASLPKLFELVEKSTESATAIAQAMTMQDNQGKTALHVMAGNAPASLLILFGLADRSPEIATAIAQAMTMQSDQGKTALHVMAGNAPASLFKLFGLAERSSEIATAIAKAMTMRDSDGSTALHVMAELASLPKLFKLAERSPEIATAIAEAMTMQSNSWTFLQTLGIYAAESLPKLFGLAERSPEIATAIAKTMTIPTDIGHSTALHLMAMNAAESLPKLFELAKTSAEIATAIAQAMTMQSDQGKTPLYMMIKYTPASLPKLFELAEIPEIAKGIAKAITILNKMSQEDPQNLKLQALKHTCNLQLFQYMSRNATFAHENRVLLHASSSEELREIYGRDDHLQNLKEYIFEFLQSQKDLKNNPVLELIQNYVNFLDDQGLIAALNEFNNYQSQVERTTQIIEIQNNEENLINNGSTASDDEEVIESGVSGNKDDQVNIAKWKSRNENETANQELGKLSEKNPSFFSQTPEILEMPKIGTRG